MNHEEGIRNRGRIAEPCSARAALSGVINKQGHEFWVLQNVPLIYARFWRLISSSFPRAKKLGLYSVYLHDPMPDHSSTQRPCEVKPGGKV